MKNTFLKIFISIIILSKMSLAQDSICALKLTPLDIASQNTAFIFEGEKVVLQFEYNYVEGTIDLINENSLVVNNHEYNFSDIKKIYLKNTTKNIIICFSTGAALIALGYYLETSPDVSYPYNDPALIFYTIGTTAGLAFYRGFVYLMRKRKYEMSCYTVSSVKYSKNKYFIQRIFGF